MSATVPPIDRLVDLADYDTYDASVTARIAAASTLRTQIISEDQLIALNAAAERSLVIFDTSVSQADFTGTLPAASTLVSRSVICKKRGEPFTAHVAGVDGEPIDGRLVRDLEMDNEFIELTGVEVSLGVFEYQIIGKG